MGNIPVEKNLFIKYVNGLIKLLTHCLAIDVGMSSHPGLEFFNDCRICKTSLGGTSDITILFGILLTNDKELILDVILLANLSPIETKKSLNLLAIITLTDMQPLSSYAEEVLLTLYNTLILPHLSYCILVWGSKIQTNHRLHLLQKKAVRIITNKDYVAHTEPLCKLLNILKAADLFKCSLWKLYYNLTKRQLPAYFDIMQCYQSYQTYAIIIAFAFPHFIFH